MFYLLLSVFAAVPFFCFAQVDREVEGKVLSVDSLRRELVLSYDVMKVEQGQEKFIVKNDADLGGLNSLSSLDKGDNVRAGISEGKIVSISSVAGDAAGGGAGVKDDGGSEGGSFSGGKQDLDCPGENRFILQDE